MELISTKDLTHDTAPEGQVLVQFLEPFFGGWTVSFAVGYYDNPNDDGKGWRLWSNDNCINVIAYANLPEPIDTALTGLSQIEFITKFGSGHPNNGHAGSLIQ